MEIRKRQLEAYQELSNVALGISEDALRTIGLR